MNFLKMKKFFYLFITLAVVGVLVTSCEEEAIQEDSIELKKLIYQNNLNEELHFESEEFFTRYFELLNEVNNPTELKLKDYQGLILTTGYEMKEEFDFSLYLNQPLKEIDPLIIDLVKKIDSTIQKTGFNKKLNSDLTDLYIEIRDLKDQFILEEDGFVFLKNKIAFYKFISENENAINFISKFEQESLSSNKVQNPCLNPLVIVTFAFYTTACVTGSPIACVIAAWMLTEFPSCFDDDTIDNPCQPTVYDDDVCESGITTSAGPQECDFYGGQYINYFNGCNDVIICCIDEY